MVRPCVGLRVDRRTNPFLCTGSRACRGLNRGQPSMGGGACVSPPDAGTGTDQPRQREKERDRERRADTRTHSEARRRHTTGADAHGRAETTHPLRTGAQARPLSLHTRDMRYAQACRHTGAPAHGQVCTRAQRRSALTGRDRHRHGHTRTGTDAPAPAPAPARARARASMQACAERCVHGGEGETGPMASRWRWWHRDEDDGIVIKMMAS